MIETTGHSTFSDSIEYAVTYDRCRRLHIERVKSDTLIGNTLENQGSGQIVRLNFLVLSRTFSHYGREIARDIAFTNKGQRIGPQHGGP